MQSFDFVFPKVHNNVLWLTLYTVALIPMRSSILKFRIHHFSPLHLSVVVSSTIRSLFIVSNIWKFSLASLVQHLLKCSETGMVLLLILKVSMDGMCSYILALFCFPHILGSSFETGDHIHHVVCETGQDIWHSILPFRVLSIKELGVNCFNFVQVSQCLP